MKRTTRFLIVFTVLLLLAALLFAFVRSVVYPRYLRSVYKIAYREQIEKYAEEFDVPKEVCYAVVWAESGFDETALSHAGAVGLMQLMPSTFSYLAAKHRETLDPEQIYDAETNLRLGIFYLSMLYARFGVWETVYAAYNAGPGRVSGWLSESGREDGVLTEIPLAETKNYVARVSRAAALYKELYS